MSENRVDAQTIANMVPMKRAGTPTEVADLVSFLLPLKPLISLDRLSRSTAG